MDRGPGPELLEQVRLLSRSGHEFIEPVAVQAAAGVGQRAQGAPASGLALHAQPQHLQFFQALRSASPVSRREGRNEAMYIVTGTIVIIVLSFFCCADVFDEVIFHCCAVS
jgi:hypothetical protein